MFEKEGDVMCEALEELMKDKLEAQLPKDKEIGQKIGQEMGKLQGERQGTSRVNQLSQKLIALGRMDDMLKSVSDTVFQQKLFKEFHL